MRSHQQYKCHQNVALRVLYISYIFCCVIKSLHI